MRLSTALVLTCLPLTACLAGGGDVPCNGSCVDDASCGDGLGCFDVTTGRICLPLECAACFSESLLCVSDVSTESSGEDVCVFSECRPGGGGERWEYAGTIRIEQYSCSASAPGSSVPCPVQLVSATGFVNYALGWVEISYTHPGFDHLDSGDRCEEDPSRPVDENHWATSFTEAHEFTMSQGGIVGRFDESTLSGGGCSIVGGSGGCDCDSGGGWGRIEFTLSRVP